MSDPESDNGTVSAQNKLRIDAGEVALRKVYHLPHSEMMAILRESQRKLTSERPAEKGTSLLQHARNLGHALSSGIVSVEHHINIR